MDLKEMATAMGADQVRRKDMLVTETTAEENDDITPAIELWRGDDMLGLVVCPQVDRDQALDAIWMAVPKLGLDAIVVTLDTHFSNHATKPDGTPWTHGSMQQLCDTEGLCEVGWITDSITALAYDRHGNNAMAFHPYHINKAAREVHWKEDPTMGGEGAAGGGLVHDVITRAFKEPTKPFFSGQLPEVMAALFAVLLMRGYVVLVTTQDEAVRDAVGALLQTLPGMEVNTP